MNHSYEEQLILQHGAALEDLESHPGFILIMDMLTAQAEDRLRTLRDLDSSDPQVVQDVYRKWREVDLVIDQIRMYIQSAKLAKQDLTQEGI